MFVLTYVTVTDDSRANTCSQYLVHPGYQVTFNKKAPDMYDWVLVTVCVLWKYIFPNEYRRKKFYREVSFDLFAPSGNSEKEMIVVRTPEHVKLSGPDANLIEVTVKKMTPNKAEHTAINTAITKDIKWDSKVHDNVYVKVHESDYNEAHGSGHVWVSADQETRIKTREKHVW